MKNIRNMLKRGFYNNEIEYSALQKMIKENSNIILLDVRSAQEFKEGHLLGALNLPLGELENKAGLLMPNQGQTIVAYCQRGVKSKAAANLLIEMGYTDVYELKGGLDSI